MAYFLEKLYPYVPFWAQNLGITLYGYGYRHERMGGRFREHVRDFAERDTYSPDEMQSYVETRLREVLVHAFDHVPYYASKWQAAGVQRAQLLRFTIQDLSRLDLTPKCDLRNDPYQFVASSVPKRSRLTYYSSGSTGTPIAAICTADGHRRFLAAREVRSFGWAGTSIRAPRSMMGGRMIIPRSASSGPFYRYNYAEQQVYFTAYHISPRNAPAYVEGFNRYRPRLLTGYAYSHFTLGRMMLEQGLKLDYSPDAIVLSSEKLTPEMKLVIQKAFGARAYEEYGAIEQCVLATECERGSLHISPDYGIVEILDDAGDPTPPGVPGQLVCTSLVNEAQPLIRYQIGDVGVWSEQGCRCGRNHLPVLKELVGRLEDVVVGPDGTEMVRFHGIFIGLPHVIEGQIIQEQIDLLRVRVVATDGFGPQDERLIRRRITGERLHGMRVVIEPVESIARTERGKFKSVISMLPPEVRRAVRQRPQSAGAN